MRQFPLRALLPLLTVAGLGACNLDPSRPVLRYELSPGALELNEDLQADPVAQDQIRGALEMLFGTPQNPGYLGTEDWVDEEFFPNYGQDELSDGEFDVLFAENEKHFSAQIAAIEEGRWESVSVPSHAIVLGARWDDLMEERAELVEDPAALEAWEAEGAEEAIGLFAGWYPTLSESAELYRVQCLHCHGVEGGGNGPTSDFLTPRPRDYRDGKFKYTALNNKARPRRQDLLNILQQGVYTTSMPSFARFSSAQLNGLVDYVRLLSIRGETETLLALDYDPDDGLPFETIQETYQDVWGKWLDSGEELIVFEDDVPHPTRELIAHGRELFLDPMGANCVSCHGESGRGDGASAREPDPESGKLVYVDDEWGNPISPRDLTQGVFRFGRRPIDLYRRIYAGINGTPMPAHFGMDIPDGEGGKRKLDEEDVWSLVHYVRSLSVHEMAVTQAPQAGDHGAGH